MALESMHGASGGVLFLLVFQSQGAHARGCCLVQLLSRGVCICTLMHGQSALTSMCAPAVQVLLHNSKQLDDAATLSEAGVTEGATLSVSSRLRGGGGDGGSTGAESRSCYLEMYAERKPDKVRPAVT